MALNFPVARNGGIVATTAGESTSTFGASHATTTISTIAVRAEPHTTIVIAILKSHGYVELRIDEMQPGLLELGGTTDESRQLLDSHNDLVDRLTGKQPQVEDLLARADQLVSDQKEENDILVYEAMAESLGGAWKELNRQLELRGYILFDAHHLHQLADEHAERVHETNSLLRDAIAVQEQQQAEKNGLMRIVASIEKSIDELMTITAVGVDLGSQLISQLKVLGSLADSEGRPQEVADACLHVEKLMLKMAQQWELLDSYWSAEREKLSQNAQPAEQSGGMQERTRAFLAGAEVALAQLRKMREDLLTSSGASMASELGPLANQKAGPLITEGEKLLNIMNGEGVEVAPLKAEVGGKLAALRSMLGQLVEMAHERIATAKSGNDRLRENINSLSNWLGGVVELQLSGPASRIGASSEEAQHFIAANKKLSADVVGREPEILSLFAHASELPAHDRKALAGVQQRYESARDALETRMQLGRILELVHKFRRELDNSFDQLTSLIQSSDSDGISMVQQEVRTIYQTVQETLHRERHQGEKFIATAEQAVRRDSQLAIQASIETINNLLATHDRRFEEVRELLEKWERSIAGATNATAVADANESTRIEPGKPVFVQALQAAGVVEGETAVLDCVVVANPEPTVVWYREENEGLKESDRVQLHFRGDHCSLSILNTSVADSGLYKVCAVNVHGESTSFCRLKVMARNASPSASLKSRVPPATPPKPITPIETLASGVGGPYPPLFKPALENRTVKEGQAAVMEVGVGGEPFPSVQWYFQEACTDSTIDSWRVLIPSTEPDTSGSPLTTSRIVMPRVELGDAGIYMVVARNDLGEARCGASLNVIPRRNAIHEELSQQFEEHTEHRTEIEQVSEILTDNSVSPPPIPVHRGVVESPTIMPADTYTGSRVREMGDAGYSSLAKAPEFIKAFQAEYVVDEGERIRLDSMMVGNPRPRIQWYFNQQPVVSDYRFVELLNVGDTYSIQMSPAKLEHAGHYRIVAENVRGRCESSTLIHVRPRSMQQGQSLQKFPYPPQVRGQIEGGQYKSVERDQMLSDFKGAAGYPIFIESPPTRHPPPARAMSASTHVASGEQPMLLRPRRASSTAVTNESWDAPHFTQTLISCVCAVGDEARFEATVLGWPQPEVEWSKDGARLGGTTAALGSPVEFIAGEDGRVALIFRSVQSADAGKFMCTARNASGVATSSAQLVVRARTQAPDFLRRLVSEEVVEGERLQWTVEVSGDPSPTVTWLRDGQPIPNCEEVRLVQYEREPGLYSMIVERVELEDAGQFTCLLENSAGEARSTADLLVRKAGSEPGNYFHITKVLQEKQLRGEELSRNQTLSVERPLPTPSEQSQDQKDHYPTA